MDTRRKLPKRFFKLFDCQIQPMLTYGAEAWGLIVDHTVIERVHLFTIKRLFNISAKTPSALVYGEAGRYPLYIQTYTKCIKYWLKVTRMTEDRIPSKAYKMLFSICFRSQTRRPFLLAKISQRSSPDWHSSSPSTTLFGIRQANSREISIIRMGVTVTALSEVSLNSGLK